MEERLTRPISAQQYGREEISTTDRESACHGNQLESSERGTSIPRLMVHILSRISLCLSQVQELSSMLHLTPKHNLPQCDDRLCASRLCR